MNHSSVASIVSQPAVCPSHGRIQCLDAVMKAGDRTAAGVDRRSLERASQALRCLPFRHTLFEALATTPLSCGDIASAGDVYSRRCLSASVVESHLIWLIKLGVLRREVDGQGLTERVRLTPMGLMVLEHFHGEILPADLISRCHHWLRRHWPRS